MDANAHGATADDVEVLTSAVLTASRLLVGISIRSLAAADQKVTLAQFRMLALLTAHGETNLVTLAECLMVNPSTALRMVERLADGGFVSRRVNPESRREVLLQLTPAGRKVVDGVITCRRNEIATIVSKMSARHRIDLVRALRAFAAAGGGEVPPGNLGLLDWA